MVAAIARVLALRTRAAQPDVALLAGLLHNVGSVYLFARADKHLDLFRNTAIRDLLLHDWQAPIGKAIAHRLVSEGADHLSSLRGRYRGLVRERDHGSGRAQCVLWKWGRHARHVRQHGSAAPGISRRRASRALG